VTLKYRSLMTITAVGIGLALGWGLGTQPIHAQDAKASEKKWKGKDGGQEEFQLASAADKATDAKAKVAALDKWRDAFPQSDFSDERNDLYLGAYQQAMMTRQAFDKALEINKLHPNHFYSLQIVLTTVQNLMPASPADLDNAARIAMYVLDNADTAFANANKPATITDAQWPAVKPAMKAAAHNAYLYTVSARKDPPREEAELTAYLKKDPTQASTSYTLAGAILAQNKTQPQKQPLALYQFARAAAYTGPNALPAAAQKQALDYITKTYTAYHGSAQGLQELLATAKANPFPPEGFTIDSVSDIAVKKAQAQAAADAANPQFAFWRDLVKEPLLKDGDMYFDAMKGALLPGEPGKAKGVEKFKATLISMEPANKPKTLVLGLEKPDAADVTLKFEEPLPGTMEPGATLEFEGAPSAYRKEPFMVTFDVDMEQKQLVGWTGVNAKGAAKGGAAKGGAAKGATKAGKAAPKGKQ
jgi:hypothetical protein